MANPVCSDLGDIVEQTARKIKLHVKRGGTYLVMEGPQFSTLAESRLYRTLGSDIIGMTNMPEAKLAREAEISYCSIAMVTDYDCWHDDHENVTAQSVLASLSKNISEAKRLIQTTITSLDKIYNWGRRSSIWPMVFGLACCAIEMICTAASRFDIARFGMEVFRATPRQADLMIVSGTVTKKMVPQIVRLFNQMPEPKYVMAMGACASGGGPFKEGYNVVSGIDKFVPVDVYVPGCPPTPQALLHGLIKLQEKIDGQSLKSCLLYTSDAADE